MGVRWFDRIAFGRRALARIVLGPKLLLRNSSQLCHSDEYRCDFFSAIGDFRGDVVVQRSGVSGGVASRSRFLSSIR